MFIAAHRTILLAALSLVLAAPAPGDNWPMWRGAGGQGISDETGMPIKWDSKTNITWKAPLPDEGNSTPAIWGDRVIVTCAQSKGKIRSTICLDRASGKERWKKDIAYAEAEETHQTNPYCSASPATDGKLVIVWHGSAGLFAYDLDGNEKWKRDLGRFEHIWGNAGSPVIDGDRVYLSAGPGLTHKLLCLKKETGETIWEQTLTDAQSKETKQFKGSWSTPVLHTVGGQKQMVLSLPQKLCGIDPDTGKEIWHCKGLSDLVYTSPLIGGGVIVGMSGYGGPAIGMKEPSADDKGDLTATHRLWVHPKNPQRVGSGVLVDGHVYILNESGVAYCLEAKTGKELWGEGKGVRVGGGTWSSMVHADGKLWISNLGGQTFVLKASPTYELLSTNPLGEGMRASLAFSDGQVFIRTFKGLYCVGERLRQPR